MRTSNRRIMASMAILRTDMPYNPCILNFPAYALESRISAVLPEIATKDRVGTQS